MINRSRVRRNLPVPCHRLCALLSLIVLSECAVQAADSPEQTATALAGDALTNSRTMQIITELTTDIGPRLAGSEAEKRAANWAKDCFERLGFDNVRIESFPLEDGWARGVEKAEVISPSPQPLVVTALGHSVATPPEGIEAEIVLFKTYDEFLAAPTNSLKGKIVAVTQRLVRTQNGGGYGFVNKIRNDGPAEAAKRGAAAYLSRSLGTDSHRMPHAGVTDFPESGPRIPAAALSMPDADQLERLVSKGSPVRVKLVLTPRNLGTVSSQNVIAEIKGREKPDEIVLIGAHLDSWDLGTGAIDDGAGVAIVMSVGKLIRDLAEHPKRTIRVVLFGSEEVGLFGGKAYLESHKAELNRHVICAEPDFGQGPIYAFETGVADPGEPSLKRMQSVFTPLGIIRGGNESKGSSDVEPLVEAGVPAVTLKMDGSDYFDLHHTPDDTLDKVKPERINQSAAAFAAFTYLAAELDGNYRAKPSMSTK